MPETLTIFGASARAAAASALRAGFAACSVDLFADVDTLAMGRALRIDDYPAGFLQAAQALPGGPWIYTGGLENYPEVVDAIGRRMPLWGNAAGVLRRVRDPVELQVVLQQAGLPALDVRRNSAGLPRDGTWLAKPLRSAGGLEIHLIDEALPATRDSTGDVYYQKLARGQAVSALFVAAHGEARLIGATRQLVGASWTGATPFLYAGSIGPLSLATGHVQTIERIGRVLAAEFELVGLFGVDGIVDAEAFWTVEVNPRYVASAEILERAGETNLLRWHADACCLGRLPATDRLPHPRSAQELWGKAILYAPAAVTIGKPFVDLVALWNGEGGWPSVADIPHFGEAIAKRSPVATVFAAGVSEDAVETQLALRCELMRANLCSEE